MVEHSLDSGPLPVRGDDLESTTGLLKLIRRGDSGARERLLRRYLAPLQRWAHGRLPRGARSLVDTDDLVQETLLRTLNHLESFEPDWKGAFLAYLRQALLNQIRDELRRAMRKPGTQPMADLHPDPGPNPLEQAIGNETLRCYDEAMLTLPRPHQDAVIMRIELGFTHQEVADALGLPSANAARMAVARALLHLAKEMRESHEPPG